MASRGRPKGSRKFTLELLRQREGDEAAEAYRRELSDAIATYAPPNEACITPQARKLLLVMLLSHMLNNAYETYASCIKDVAALTHVPQQVVREVYDEWRQGAKEDPSNRARRRASNSSAAGRVPAGASDTTTAADSRAREAQQRAREANEPYGQHGQYIVHALHPLSLAPSQLHHHHHHHHLRDQQQHHDQQHPEHVPPQELLYAPPQQPHAGNGNGNGNGPPPPLQQMHGHMTLPSGYVAYAVHPGSLPLPPGVPLGSRGDVLFALPPGSLQDLGRAGGTSELRTVGGAASGESTIAQGTDPLQAAQRGEERAAAAAAADAIQPDLRYYHMAFAGEDVHDLNPDIHDNSHRDSHRGSHHDSREDRREEAGEPMDG